MTETRAQRTLVKSPPELWAEISDVETLARHLGEFGEIRITHVEPETTVAWEGEAARGTVELATSGWGTKVTLTAEAVGAEEPVLEAPDTAEGEPPAPRSGFFARWFSRREKPAPAAEVVAVVVPEPEPIDSGKVLESVLDDLGSAHRRPFSAG